MSDKTREKIHLLVELRIQYYNRIMHYVGKGKWRTVNDFINDAVIDKLLEAEGEEK